MPELLRMPEVATDATEALLVSWPVPVTGQFSAHDTIATIETAKATVDVEAESDGVLLATLVAEGTEVATGTPIALIGARGEMLADVNAALVALGVSSPNPGVGSDPKSALALDVPEADRDPSAAVATIDIGAVPMDAGGADSARRFASPLARRLARNAGLTLDSIAGTGPNARIVRRDVEAAKAEETIPNSEPVVGMSPGKSFGPSVHSNADGPAVQLGTPGQRADTTPAAADLHFTDRPHSRARRTIAARLVESKQTAPHFYLRASARVDGLLNLRSELNADGSSRVSLTDLIVKAVAQAHLRVPEMNVVWTADAVRTFSRVDVAVAVAVEDGLVTPVLQGVDTLSVTALARSMNDLIAHAREGTLRQRDLEGGTITVTNLGMYGTEEFVAIINPPQAAILAIGAARQEPVVRDGQLGIESVMRLTLSVDHRPIDGVTAARWMQHLISILEHPVQVLA